MLEFLKQLWAQVLLIIFLVYFLGNTIPLIGLAFWLITRDSSFTIGEIQRAQERETAVWRAFVGLCKGLFWVGVVALILWGIFLAMTVGGLTTGILVIGAGILAGSSGVYCIIKRPFSKPEYIDPKHGLGSPYYAKGSSFAGKNGLGSPYYAKRSPLAEEISFVPRKTLVPLMYDPDDTPVLKCK